MRPFAATLNRVVTLQRPSTTAGAGLALSTDTYAAVATVRASYRAASASQLAEAGGYLQVGACTLTIRRPVQAAGVEVVPDVGWRATMQEAGETRTLHVDGVVDGDATGRRAYPSVRSWVLSCSDARVPA